MFECKTLYLKFGFILPIVCGHVHAVFVPCLCMSLFLSALLCTKRTGSNNEITYGPTITNYQAVSPYVPEAESMIDCITILVADN